MVLCPLAFMLNRVKAMQSYNTWYFKKFCNIFVGSFFSECFLVKDVLLDDDIVYYRNINKLYRLL